MGSGSYLEKAMMMDHPILIVQKREEGELCVQQHFALTFLLGFCAVVILVLQGEDLCERDKGRAAQDRTFFCSQKSASLKCNANKITAGHRAPWSAKLTS